MQHRDSGVLALVMAFHPCAETGKGCCESGDAESQGLQRSIAPGLIVRREQRQVHAAKEVVVGHIEHTVVSVKVGRDEIHLHLVSNGVCEAHLTEAARNGVVFGILEIVRHLGLVTGVTVSGEFGAKLLVRSVMAGRNHYERLDASAGVFPAVYAVQGIYEHVNSLVTVFVAAADADEKGILGHFLCAHGGGNLHNALARGVVEGIVGFVRGRGETVLEAVWRNDIHGTQELRALLSRDFAHRCEDISVFGRFLLQRIDGLHVETGGHFVSVVT